MHLRRQFSLVLAAAAIPLPSAWAAPTAIRFIVPYPAGGVMDAVGRLLAPFVQEAFEQQVVVENVPGAGGSIGLHQLAGVSRGVAVALGTDSDSILVPLATPAAGDIPALLRLSALLGGSPMALCAGRDPSKVLKALQAPNTSADFSCGNFGVDSNSHLLALDLERRLKASVVHVPYKGVAPVVQDLAGGQIDAAFLPLAGLQAHIDGGRISVVGVCAPSRAPQLPTTPTMNELLHVSDFNYESWSGLFVPRASGDDIARRANAAVSKALDDAGFREALGKMGVTLAQKNTLMEADRYFQRAVAVAKTLKRG